MTLTDQINQVAIEILSERIGIIMYPETNKVKMVDAEAIAIEEAANIIIRKFAPLKKDQAINLAQKALLLLPKYPKLEI